MIHVIVQAGGRGSRLRHFTWNKPKCLVSVKGKPILYHLFDKFTNAHFHIIGDYGYEQLDAYLNTNDPGVEYTLYKAQGKGTSSGISEVLENIPENAQVILMWSDLLLTKPLDIPELVPYSWPVQLPQNMLPIVYITSAFTCRWSVNDNFRLQNKPSNKTGVPGIFHFYKNSHFPIPPDNAEFVKWFCNNVTQYDTLQFNDMEELGDFDTIELQNDQAGFSRFFNEVVIGDEVVTKKAIDPNYEHLIDKEQEWYKTAKNLGFRRIPEVLSTTPYTLQKINGRHAYQMDDLSDRERRAVMCDYIDSLSALHDKGTKPSVVHETSDVYLYKTINRVESVSKLIPNYDKDSITVNGRKCKNILLDKDLLASIVHEHLIPKTFHPIHGDPTFSNTLVDNNLRTWYIDPRGYFSTPGIYGDKMYDFAKLYYSAVGGYDAFNRRKFKLHVDDETVEILMEKPKFTECAELIFNDYFGADKGKIEVIHGLIWLALSGYVKDDIDSIIGSFYYGLYWLEEGIKKL
jgi:GTP:adenosylcobinamide-phosphate guanylyltransferase